MLTSTTAFVSSSQHNTTKTTNVLQRSAMLPETQAPLDRIAWIAETFNREGYGPTIIANLGWITDHTIHTMMEIITHTVDNVKGSMATETALSTDLYAHHTTLPYVREMQMSTRSNGFAIAMEYDYEERFEGKETILVRTLNALLHNATHYLGTTGKTTFTIKDKQGAVLLMLTDPTAEISDGFYHHLLGHDREILSSEQTDSFYLRLSVTHGTIEFGQNTKNTPSRDNSVTLAFHLTLAIGQDAESEKPLMLNAIMRYVLPTNTIPGRNSINRYHSDFYRAL